MVFNSQGGSNGLQQFSSGLSCVSTVTCALRALRAPRALCSGSSALSGPCVLRLPQPRSPSSLCSEHSGLLSRRFHASRLRAPRVTSCPGLGFYGLRAPRAACPACSCSASSVSRRLRASAVPCSAGSVFSGLGVRGFRGFRSEGLGLRASLFPCPAVPCATGSVLGESRVSRAKRFAHSLEPFFATSSSCVVRSSRRLVSNGRALPVFPAWRLDAARAPGETPFSSSERFAIFPAAF